MRTLRKSLAAAVLAGMGLAPSLVSAAPPAPAEMLAMKPTQKGVMYDIPTDQSAIAACKVEAVKNNAKDTVGYALRDSQGKLLRKFVDSNNNRKLDQWSYYQDGFEVYREVDLDGNLTADECRWMNSGGTRIMTLGKEGRIGWKRISPEEVTSALVVSITGPDAALFASLFVTPEELKAIGAPEAEIERVTKDTAQRSQQFEALIKSLGSKGWNRSTSWLCFSGSTPRSTPKDSFASLQDDLILYENCAVFVGNTEGDPTTKLAHMQIPELVKIGDVWKMVDPPRAIDPGATTSIVQNQTGLRAAIAQANPQGTVIDPRLDALLKQIGEYDSQNASRIGSMTKDQEAKYYLGRADLLIKVVQLVQGDDKALYEKQVVDGLAAAYQTGVNTDSATRLDAIIAQGDKLSSYAAFRKILADYGIKNNEEGANLVSIQKKLVEELKAFVAKYTKSDEAPDALLQLANVNEFNGDEDESRKYFDQLVRNYPETSAGKKAGGALKRLDLVGKVIELKGQDVKGNAIDISQYRGKYVLVQFWASWAEQARKDLPELVQVAQKHKAKGFEVIGVNFDNEKSELENMINLEKLAWPQIHEAGGLDNIYAQQFGIMSLPTMVLVDQQGKVVSRTLRTAAELDKQLEKLYAAAAKPGGSVALDNK